jgi:glutathione peroxidase
VSFLNYAAKMFFNVIGLPTFTIIKKMKKLFALIMLFGLIKTTYLHAQSVPKTIYDFKVEALDGTTIDFSKFKGKKILIVNTASKCGYTGQYADLQKLSEKYKNDLVIVGFPANDFMFQEPGDNKEIATFCQKNYGVTFPMAAKITVKGKKTHPMYLWLTQKKFNGVEDSNVKWNFQKYLIDEKGNYVAKFGPGTEPMDAEIVNAIAK